ncbi:Polypeptide N-acetylgalactosaminyltransferase 5, partial [Bulinus truncatus]
ITVNILHCFGFNNIRKQPAMRGHRKVFRFLVLIAVLWMTAVLVMIYAAFINRAEMEVKLEDRPYWTPGSEELRKLMVNDDLVKHVANQVALNASMKHQIAAMLNLWETTQTTPTKTTEIINLFKFFQKFWPEKAKPNSTGYGGEGITIDPKTLEPRAKTIFDTGYNVYKVNQLASESIPLRREILIDMPECKNLTYDITKLGKAGVVLIFHNELWSVLLRAVYSILDAGPEELISEIILVDDASDKEFLWRPLEEYIKIFGGKVKLVRLPSRKGLILARNEGFEHVTGSVAVFLDAHVEVHKGWLEPLLDRIRVDDKTLAVPQHDQIHWDTFKYHFTGNAYHHRGGFELDLTFSWIGPPPPPDGVVRKTLADPIKSPTHLGCCFAIATSNFERLGRYDPGLSIWGCENLELSFKSWMCGGSVELVPCSHVGHLYRPSFPYSWGDGKDTLVRNCLRVAEVWLDEYKDFFYSRIFNLQNSIDVGDISNRKSLRANLQCKSFDWYLKEVYPDLYLPLNTTAIGKIQSSSDATLCVVSDVRWQFVEKSPTVTKCDDRNLSQHFFLSKEKQIRRDDNCMMYETTKNQVVMRPCYATNTQWEYTQVNTIMAAGANLCLSFTRTNWTVVMAACNDENLDIKWNWSRQPINLHKN